MLRKTVFPEGHWSLQVEIPYSMGLACGELIFLCGQADLEGDGQVCHAGDLLRQSQSAIDHIDNLFQALEANLEDLVKLVVFYVPDSTLTEAGYIDALAAMLTTRNRPVITLVPVPRMFYPGLVVEIDAYGMTGDSIRRFDVAGDHGFSSVVRSGEMIFGGGIDAIDAAGTVTSPYDAMTQSRIVLEKLSVRLADVGAGVGDLVKINNWYVAGGSAEEWASVGPGPVSGATGVSSSRPNSPCAPI